MGAKYDKTSRKVRCVRKAKFRSEFDSLAHFGIDRGFRNSGFLSLETELPLKDYWQRMSD